MNNVQKSKLIINCVSITQFRRVQMRKNNEIAIFKSKDGVIELQVKLDNDTVWLTQKQLSNLFDLQVPAINKHLNNIFKTKELEINSVISKMEITASDGKVYKTNIYNLDAIISVGYRVNSKRGTEFRIWASSVLKQYLVNGYAINEKRLKTQVGKIKELHETINLLEHVMHQKELKSDEAVGLLEVIKDYTLALDLLDRYDHETLQIEKSKLSKKKALVLSYEEALSVVQELARKFGASSLFGKEKDKSFSSSINGIYQTFGGVELYPSIEEKSSNLLYFLVKNHSFVDGNKRIAASIFLYFLNKNRVLYKADGSRILNDNALVAVTLMIAESKPEHKDTIVKMLVNLIDKKN